MNYTRLSDVRRFQITWQLHSKTSVDSLLSSAYIWSKFRNHIC